MSGCEMKRSIKELEPYAKILNHHIEATLKSHLLLDEDLDSLYKIWNHLEETFSTKKHFAYVACVAAVGVGSFAIFKTQHKLMYLAISAIPLIAKVAYDCFKMYRIIACIKQSDDVIAALKKQFTLNNQVLAHLKRQEYAFNTLSETSKELYANSLNSTYTLKFIKIAINNLLNVCLFMQNELKYYSEKLPDNENYLYLIDWNLKTVINDYSLIELKRMFDAYILITSNYLGCTSLYLCDCIWNKNTQQIDHVLYKSIPLLLKCLLDNLSSTELKFNEQLKVPISEPPPPTKAINNKPKETNIFEAPIIEIMNKLQLTYGLTNALHAKIHKDSSQIKVDEVASILVDLNDKLNETHSVLRTLQKIANLLTHKSEVNAIIEVPPKIDDIKIVDNKLLISFDDVIECNDETFSGYSGLPIDDLKIISLNEINEGINSEEMLITQSQLINELDQKLTEVRKKKGIESHKPKMPVPLPRRNKSFEEVMRSPRPRTLKIIGATPENENVINKPISLENVPIPPPPPPPHMIGLENCVDPKKTLYENVAAQRLKVTEEIYEDETN